MAILKALRETRPMRTKKCPAKYTEDMAQSSSGVSTDSTQEMSERPVTSPCRVPPQELGPSPECIAPESQAVLPRRGVKREPDGAPAEVAELHYEEAELDMVLVVAAGLRGRRSQTKRRTKGGKGGAARPGGARFTQGEMEMISQPDVKPDPELRPGSVSAEEAVGGPQLGGRKRARKPTKISRSPLE